MSSLVYPNIGSVEEDNEAQKQVFIEKTMQQPSVVVNNYTIQKEEPILIEQPKIEVVQEQKVAPVPAPSSADVEYYGSRLKITSWALIAIGVVSLGSSLHAGLGARHIAEMVMNGPQHGPEGDFAGGRHPRPPHPHPHPVHDKWMSRDEFALYDIIKTLAFAALFFSMALFGLGKHALCSLKMGTSRPGMVKRLVKRSLYRVAFLALCSIFIAHHIKEAIMVAEHHNKQSPHSDNRAEMTNEFEV